VLCFAKYVIYWLARPYPIMYIDEEYISTKTRLHEVR